LTKKGEPKTISNCTDEEWSIVMRWICLIGSGHEQMPDLGGSGWQSVMRKTGEMQYLLKNSDITG
jgi:hypothetical protein